MKMKVICLLAIFALICNAAFAGLVVDLRPTTVTGAGGTTIDGKTIVPTPTSNGDKILIEVWATVTDLPEGGYGLLQSLGGTIKETVPANASGKGSMSWGTSTLGATNQANYVYDYPTWTSIALKPTATTNAWSDVEMGNVNAPFSPRSSDYQDTTGTWVKVGKFSYTLNSVNMAGTGSTLIDFTPGTTAGNANYKTYNAEGADPRVYDGLAPGFVSAGPINIKAVPEPATLVLLGMGALALVFIRRRK